MYSRSIACAAAAVLAVAGLSHAAHAQAFPTSITGWGTLGVLQTRNIPQCNLNGLFGSPTSGFAQYPAHLVNAGGGFYSIDYSGAPSIGTTVVQNVTYGASLQFQPTGFAGLIVAGSGSTAGPNIVASVAGNFGGAPVQQGGIAYLNIAFFYSANGATCGAQITGTFFAVPLGG